MLNRTRWTMLLAVACIIWAQGAVSARSPGKAEIERRLDYLVALKSFSKSKPLSQTRLMKLILDLGASGKFPESYKSGKPMKGCEDYITRANVRRFTRELLGEDLRMWSLLGEDFMPKIEGDKLGWWFNTGNTMYDRPKVLLTSRKNSARRITVQFRIFHRKGNRSNSPPATLVATGKATLEPIRNNWIVKSWRVNRNKNWAYSSGWGG